MPIHNLGFPRMGARRELKFALEAYWRGELEEAALLATARRLRARHWRLQGDLDWVPVGDFSLYDHVLDTTVMLGAIPERFAATPHGSLAQYFHMARGRAPGTEPTAACEMTKWFDTNYHYIVPELAPELPFELQAAPLLEALREAQALGVPARPVLLGPLTWLWLGKIRGPAFDRLQLMEALVPRYETLLQSLAEAGCAWVQVDEPILVLDLPQAWQTAFQQTYARLAGSQPKLLLTTYFGPLGGHLDWVARLPVAGLHLDAVRAPEEVEPLAERLRPDQVLSLGVVDGRNVWKTDLAGWVERLRPLRRRLGERLWLAPSCSLLHVPLDLDLEEGLDPEVRAWLAFGVQKLDELRLLDAVLAGDPEAAERLAAHQHHVEARRRSARVHDRGVAERLAGITEAQLHRASPYPVRRRAQQARLHLPPLPTTTIGSFPQTPEIRRARLRHRRGELDADCYRGLMEAEIRQAIHVQEALDLDVLVHGEPERNDMVEYFGERLAGFAFTRHGWVQSYGSRCVKPPILYGDVSRPAPMTVEWSRYAQSLTKRPVKGMLTGPVTILQWSFVRDDQPRARTALQIALALRDEVLDLEAAGIAIVQVDEPALREGLPLRKEQWPEYLEWATRAFRLATSGVRDETQIHTHMCYAEFNDIMPAIAELDADVITIETSRSAMELLEAFEDFDYPNEIGPGVYDIHSPNVPTVDEILVLLRAAARRIPPERLWVNPDCGLKTRQWSEVIPALRNMVEAARRARRELLDSISNPAGNLQPSAEDPLCGSDRGTPVV